MSNPSKNTLKGKTLVRTQENARVLRKRIPTGMPAQVALVPSDYSGADAHEGFIFRLDTDKLPRGARKVAEVTLLGDVTLLLEVPGLTDAVLSQAVDWLHAYCALTTFEVLSAEVRAATELFRQGIESSVDESSRLRNIVLAAPEAHVARLFAELLVGAPALEELTADDAQRLHPLVFAHQVLTGVGRDDLLPLVGYTPSWARILVLRNPKPVLGANHVRDRLTRIFS